jgi:hypothetical protein
VIKSKMCTGTNCKGNEYCESGLCVNGICAISKTNINTCTTDVEAACGKCDKVQCDDDQDVQCQNGSCNDKSDDPLDRTAYCYDSKFWLAILISVIGGVFLVVVSVVTFVECRRRKQRREQAA